jgi:hypothetical protein
MCMRKEGTPSALTAAFSAVLVLGAACQLDTLINPHEPPSSRPPAGSVSWPDSLVQFRTDSVTVIPPGGSAPEASVVASAVVRDTGTAPLRLEVEVQPVGSAFRGQATAASDPTPVGARAYVHLSGLADNTAFHWQARLVNEAGGATVWLAYGGNPEATADVRIAVAVTTRIEFRSQPATTTAGFTMPVVRVAVVDGQGSTITGFTGTVYLTIAPNTNPNGATLAGRTGVNADAGVATFSDLSITRAGSGYRLEATADGFAGFTSGSFAINADIAHHPRFIVQPRSTAVNQPISPAVRVAVEDIHDNVATSFTGIVYIEILNNPSGGQLEPSGDKRAAAAGIATFDNLRIDRAGDGYTIVASAVAVHALASVRFNVTP